MSIFTKIVSRIKRIPIGARSATVYTIATLFSRGLAIITVPIFTRLMSTEQIGIVNIYNSWHSLISVVATLALTSGGFAVAMKEFDGKRSEYISSILALTSLVAIGLAIIYFISPSFWNRIIGLPTSLMIVMLLSFLVEPGRDFWMLRQRYEYKYKLAGAISILSALFASALSILVVIKMGEAGKENLAEGRLIANYSIIFGVAFALWLFQFIKGKTFINIEYWKLSLQLSIPLIGYQIAAQVLGVSDRLMIDKFVNKSAVGIYGTLYSVSSISILVWNAINASFVPYLFQNIEKTENKIKDISFGMLGAYSAIAILLSFLAPEIVRILAPEEYYEAIYIMPPITAGVYFTSVAHMYSNILVYYKKTKYVMYGSVIAAILNIVLNAIFIPLYGYMAAAYTTLIGYIVMALIESIWARKIHIKYGIIKDNVYYDKRMFILSLGTMCITMFGLLLYKALVLRYITIFFVFIIAIFLVLKMAKSKQAQ